MGTESRLILNDMIHYSSTYLEVEWAIKRKRERECWGWYKVQPGPAKIEKHH